MHTHHQGDSAFKRQVVFRISADDWPLLETAASEHGSIQAAILAGLKALAGQCPHEAGLTAGGEAAETHDAAAACGDSDGQEEITAREAARLLGLKPDTVRGYIRSGRLPGRYDGTPTWRGWLTNRPAVGAYETRRSN